jgi:hypothetical protein
MTTLQISFGCSKSSKLFQKPEELINRDKQDKSIDYCIILSAFDFGHYFEEYNSTTGTIL